MECRLTRVEQIAPFLPKNIEGLCLFLKLSFVLVFCSLLLQEWKEWSEILSIVLRQCSVEWHKPIFNWRKRHGQPDGRVPLKGSQSFPSSQPAKCLFINHLMYKDNGTRTHFLESPHWSIYASHRTRVQADLKKFMFLDRIC